MKTEKSMVRNALIGFLIVALVVVGFVLIKNKNSEIDQLNEKYSDLNSLYEERDSLVNEMAGTFDEIEKNLTFVKNKRSQLQLDTKEGAVNEKEAIVADIKLMNEMLDESSKKIESLNEQLKSSGLEIKSFKNRIAALNKSVEEQNAQIAEFKNALDEKDFQLKEREIQIAEMDEQLAGLETDIQQKTDSLELKAQIITEKIDELNKAYFASGTFKELKENGVVEKNGGFLFLGKNETVQDDLNENYFTQLDKRSTDVFPLFTKKAEVISEHPDSSYSYIYEDDKIAYLKIEDPEEFWKITKYAVVQVK
jgi:DNA repair exonuclease SbcCD ATPase subunit